MSKFSDRQMECLEFVLRAEGTQVLRDKDGITKYGICSRFYPEVNVEDLTVAEASTILIREYWPEGICCPMDLVVFDTSVNCGRSKAIFWLQSAINAYLPRNYLTVDGILGPMTISALGYCPQNLLILAYLKLRLLHYQGLRKKDPLNYSGWIGRVIDLIGTLSQGCYYASRRTL